MSLYTVQSKTGDFLKEVQFKCNFLWQDKKNTGDCLIEVTAESGLIAFLLVLVFLNKGSFMAILQAIVYTT